MPSQREVGMRCRRAGSRKCCGTSRDCNPERHERETWCARSRCSEVTRIASWRAAGKMENDIGTGKGRLAGSVVPVTDEELAWWRRRLLTWPRSTLGRARKHLLSPG